MVFRIQANENIENIENIENLDTQEREPHRART